VSERESVKVLLEAAELQRKKSQDYQNPNSTVVQADYYPNGVSTIQDIIWAKILRARSLIEGGQAANFESLEDTYKDLINYASFAVAYLRGKVPGQDPERDAFNKPLPKKAEPKHYKMPADKIQLPGIGPWTPQPSDQFSVTLMDTTPIANPVDWVLGGSVAVDNLSWQSTAAVDYVTDRESK
jgi:hypothetical protein